MKERSNISKIIKTLTAVLSVCFLLTACNGSESTDGQQSRLPDITPMSADCSSTQGSGNVCEDQKTPQQLAAEQRQCWQSGILELMYEQMGAISLGMYQQMLNGAMPLMMVAFAIWFALRLMKHVSSFQEENIAEFWKEVFKQFFVCFVCGLLASSTDGLLFVLRYLVFPIYYTFLEFGGEVLNLAVANMDPGKEVTILGEKITYGQQIACVAEDLVIDETFSSFPEAPINMLKCMACAINERLGIGFMLAFTTLSDTGIMAFVIGMIIFLIFTFIKLAFVFYLVDSLFRFTIVIAIMPLLVLAYAFKKTRSWTQFGFMTALASAAYMMFIAIMIAVALLALQEIMMSPKLGLATDNVAEVRQSFKEFSVQMLCLLLLAFMIVSTMKLAQELTSTLVGSDVSSDFSKQGAKLIAVVAKFVTMGVLGLGKFALSKAGKWAGRGLKQGAVSAGRSMKKGTKKGMQSLRRVAARAFKRR